MNIAGAVALTDGVACGPSAAQLWGFPLVETPDLLHVMSAARRRADAIHGVRHHRAELRDDEVEVVLGVPVTSKRRTLRDLAAWESRTSFAVAAWDGALRRGLVTTSDLTAIGRQAWGAWAGRVHRVRRLVDRSAGSVLESVVRVELTLAGVRVSSQIRIRPGGHRYDFRVLDSIVLIECHSQAFHGERQLASDCRWDNEALEEGLVVSKVLWAEAVYEPGGLVARFASLKQRWPLPA